MVAENQDAPYGELAARFWQRISIDLQRAGHRAFSRRVARGKDLDGDGGGRVFVGSGHFNQRRKDRYTPEPTGLADIFIHRCLPPMGPVDFPTRLPTRLPPQVGRQSLTSYGGSGEP